jgi:antirestriction protein ArdC
MILDLLVPDLKEDKKEEPSLKELMVIQIDQIENLTKKLIPENS